MASTVSPSLTGSPSLPTPRRRTRFLIPVLLLALVMSIAIGALTADRRTPPVLLGASADVTGGVARIQGVIPVEADGWTPPTPSPVLAEPPGDGLHRVRILLELTAMEDDGLFFDPSRYTVSAWGAGSWNAVWSSPAPAGARQGETIDAVLMFELLDRAIDLTLELPGGPGLALGPGHHRGGS